MATVRALTEADREAWRPLWAGYLAFYREDLSEGTTERTFARLCTGADGCAGLLAVDDAGGAVGLAHLVFHPSTWAIAPYCYLEDLYVDRAARGGDVARALFDAVYAEADRRGADRVYWHTQEYNAPARSLYDQVGRRTSFIVYER